LWATETPRQQPDGPRRLVAKLILWPTKGLKIVVKGKDGNLVVAKGKDGKLVGIEFEARTRARHWRDYGREFGIAVLRWLGLQRDY
jgi:hypothetical protein